MTNNNNPLELLNLAIQKDELPSYIKGEGIYYFPNKWAETPTDINAVFLRGFNAYIKINKKELSTLNKHIENALLNVISENAIGCWWGISILYSYYFGYIENALLFEINANNLILSLNNSLKKYKFELINNNDFVGYKFKNGLWEDIINVVPKINEKLKLFSIQISI